MEYSKNQLLMKRAAPEQCLDDPRTLGVAVIGLGVGEQHALSYYQTGKCVLCWVYDLDVSRMERVLAKLGQGAKAESLDAVLTDKSVDVVSIASYDDAHFQQVVASLKAGKHLFVEKPLCRSMEELRSIKKAWQENGERQLASNLVLRAAPLYGWLKRKIEAGELGQVYAFSGEYLYGRIQKITEGWRKDVENYSVMQGGGVHLIDLMLWLTGQRPRCVSAMGNRICTDGTAFRYDDYVSATFQFNGGCIGSVTANFGCVHKHQHVVRVFGTKGTFIYDDMGARLHTSRDPSVPPAELDLQALPSSKGDLIPDFIRSILNGTDASLHTQFDFDVMSAALAADQALAANRALEIEYV